MNRSAITFLLLVCTALPASAEIYRCVQNGRPVFTDQACAPGAAPAKLPAIIGVPAERNAPDLAKQYDADSARQAGTQAGADAEWLKARRENASREDAIRKATIENRVIKGMTPAQVQRVLNLPSRVENQGSTTERWVYETGGERRTITFKNGAVSADATRTSRK